jgi:hypothetical protein
MGLPSSLAVMVDAHDVVVVEVRCLGSVVAVALRVEHRRAHDGIGVPAAGNKFEKGCCRRPF